MDVMGIQNHNELIFYSHIQGIVREGMFEIGFQNLSTIILWKTKCVQYEVFVCTLNFVHCKRNYIRKCGTCWFKFSGYNPSIVPVIQFYHFGNLQ